MKCAGKLRIIPTLGFLAGLLGLSSNTHAELGTPALVQVAETSKAELNLGPFDSAFRIGLGAGVFGYESRSGGNQTAFVSSLNLGARLLTYGDTDRNASYLGFLSGVSVAYPESTDEGTATATQIPLRLEFGIRPEKGKFYLALNGGADLYFLSEDASINTGRESNGNEFFPAIGGSMGWALNRRVGLMMRGDYIFMPMQDSYDVLASLQFGFG